MCMSVFICTIIGIYTLGDDIENPGAHAESGNMDFNSLEPKANLLAHCLEAVLAL